MAKSRDSLMHEPLRRVLHDGPAGCLVLHHYAASERQPKHNHDHVQVSFLLAGSLVETIGARPYEVTAPSACVKLTGTDHANDWGGQGVLMLSLRLPDSQFDPSVAGTLDSWGHVDGYGLRAVTRAALRPAKSADHAATFDDLFALLPQSTRDCDKPPAWLSAAKAALRDDPSISVAELADFAGVHRVHLSRTFARHFRLPLSVYRRQLMLARAVNAALRSAESLAQVAQLAGFADQSHMNREIAATFGVTPTALRHGFARFEA